MLTRVAKGHVLATGGDIYWLSCRVYDQRYRLWGVEMSPCISDGRGYLLAAGGGVHSFGNEDSRWWLALGILRG